MLVYYLLHLPCESEVVLALWEGGRKEEREGRKEGGEGGEEGRWGKEGGEGFHYAVEQCLVMYAPCYSV